MVTPNELWAARSILNGKDVGYRLDIKMDIEVRDIIDPRRDVANWVPVE